VLDWEISELEDCANWKIPCSSHVACKYEYKTHKKLADNSTKLNYKLLKIAISLEILINL